MKNRVVEIDDNVVALEIIYKGTRLLCYGQVPTIFKDISK